VFNHGTRITVFCRSRGCDWREVIAASGLTPDDLKDPEGAANVAAKPESPPGPAELAPLKVYLDAVVSAYAGSPAAEYAAKRFGVTPELGAALGLGYDDGGDYALPWRTRRYSRYPRLVVPFRGFDGVARGLQGRDISGECPSRWLAPANPDSGARWAAVAVFGLSDSYDATVITEGPGDALTAVGAGYRAVAVRGAGVAKKASVAKDIAANATGPVYLAGDGDGAGAEFNTHLGRNLKTEGADVRVIQLPAGAKDLAEWREKRPDTFADEFHQAVSKAPAWRDPDDDTEDPYAGNAAELLDRVKAFLQTHLFIQERAWFDAVTLWIASAHLVTASEDADIAPRLGWLSSTPGSGKTLAMDMVCRLTSGVLVTDPTQASILRTQAAMDYPEDDPNRPPPPVVVGIDEVDNIYKNRASENGSITAVLNTGYRRGAFVTRADKEDQTRAIRYECFGPIVWAGLAKAAIPEALLSRSLVVEMAKAMPHERPKPFRPRRHGQQAADLAAELSHWARTAARADGIGIALDRCEDDLIDLVSNRDLELWSALLLPAVLAGGGWEERALAACERLKNAGKDTAETVGVRFLRATRVVHASGRWGQGINDNGVWRGVLAERVMEEDSFFAGWGKSGITDEHVRAFLREFQLTPVTVKIGGTVSRGYRWDALSETWDRYLGASEDG
jgi:hypothetical protein